MNPFRTMPGGAVTALLFLGACCTAAAPSAKTMQTVREKPRIDEIVMFGDSYEAARRRHDCGDSPNHRVKARVKCATSE